MNSASPTTSTSTNRGGRPKDWTEPRARRLVRLYIYTRLPFELILKLLEDGVWKPGKDAANKVKNSLLGNDPRWIRPKDEDDERRRITGLKNSRRGAKFRQRVSTSHLTNEHLNIYGSGWHDDDSLTLAQSNQPSFENIKQEPSHYGSEVGANRFSWTPSGPNASRRDTSLTSSTETSMTNSFQEKLSTVSRDQAKGAWRVLKRFTFPNDPDIHRGTSFSPVFPHGPSNFSPHDEPAARGSSSAKYALPGDFLNADLFNRESICGVGFPSHETETCWCRIIKELRSPYEIWPITNDNLTIQDISSNQIRDPFGNTIFHWFASATSDRDYFLNIITQALRHNLLIHATNTAGQTFLHLLHPSWFEDEVSLEWLLNMLKDANFNILATDVYGRSFFHLLQNRRGNLIRVPAHLFDWELLRRRDAFGVKPMESQAKQSEPHIVQNMTRANPLNARNSNNMEFLPTFLEIPSERGDDARIRSQAELLRIVVDAIKVDGVNSTSQNSLSEDMHGRNALHALAEVELDIERVQHPTDDNQRHKKRKYKEEEGGEPRPESSHNSKRLEFLEGILSTSVDVNHYDNRGQTPLMAFIALRPEDSRLDKEDMERSIRKLFEAGANLEKRNGEGKTALHVAACSGKKVALKELLQLGANPYVRDACGLSVLAAIDELWAHTERDGIITARLEACRGVFTSMVQPDAQEPSVVQEWGVRRPVLTRP